MFFFGRRRAGRARRSFVGPGDFSRKAAARRQWWTSAPFASASQTTFDVGASPGIALAVVCSRQGNRPLLRAILHGIFSWFYALYFALTRRKNGTWRSPDSPPADTSSLSRAVPMPVVM